MWQFRCPWHITQNYFIVSYGMYKNNFFFFFKKKKKFLLYLIRSLVFINLIWNTWYPQAIHFTQHITIIRICATFVWKICAYHESIKRLWLDSSSIPSFQSMGFCFFVLFKSNNLFYTENMAFISSNHTRDMNEKLSR